MELLNLSDDTLFMIISKLELRDILSLLLVNKEINFLVNNLSNKFWYNLLIKEYYQGYEQMNYFHFIGDTSESNMSTFTCSDLEDAIELNKVHNINFYHNRAVYRSEPDENTKEFYYLVKGCFIKIPNALTHQSTNTYLRNGKYDIKTIVDFDNDADEDNYFIYDIVYPFNPKINKFGSYNTWGNSILLTDDKEPTIEVIKNERFNSYSSYNTVIERRRIGDYYPDEDYKKELLSVRRTIKDIKDGNTFYIDDCYKYFISTSYFLKEENLTKNIREDMYDDLTEYIDIDRFHTLTMENFIIFYIKSISLSRLLLETVPCIPVSLVYLLENSDNKDLLKDYFSKMKYRNHYILYEEENHNRTNDNRFYSRYKVYSPYHDHINFPWLCKLQHVMKNHYHTITERINGDIIKRFDNLLELGFVPNVFVICGEYRYYDNILNYIVKLGNKGFIYRMKKAGMTVYDDIDTVIDRYITWFNRKNRKYYKLICEVSSKRRRNNYLFSNAYNDGDHCEDESIERNDYENDNEMYKPTRNRGYGI